MEQMPFFSPKAVVHHHSFLGAEENVVLWCELGHNFWPQNPKNNLWSVLGANKVGSIMEEVPEFLATILALGSLALGKGFFFSLVLWRGFCCWFCVVLVLCLFLFVYFVCGLGFFFGVVGWFFLMC